MTLHCWKSRKEHALAAYGLMSIEYFAAIVSGGTCLEEAGHDGPHVFTPDEQIRPALTAKGLAATEEP